MSALPRSHFQQLNQAASAGDSRLHTDEIMVSQLYDLVKQYDADFKTRPDVHPTMLNADGTPRVFYHGTGTEFSVFDKSRINSNFGLNGGDLGFYFTPFREDAEAYAAEAANRNNGRNIVVGAYLKMENPLIVEDDGWGSAARQADLRNGDLKRWGEFRGGESP